MKQLNVYLYHTNPKQLDGYVPPPTIETITDAIMNEMDRIREHLHNVNMYDVDNVAPPFDVLMKYVNKFKFSQPQSYTVVFNFKDVAGEFLVTDELIKAYINDNRVAHLPINELTAADVLRDTHNSTLYEFIILVLKLVAKQLSR